MSRAHGPTFAPSTWKSPRCEGRSASTLERAKRAETAERQHEQSESRAQTRPLAAGPPQRRHRRPRQRGHLKMRHRHPIPRRAPPRNRPCPNHLPRRRRTRARDSPRRRTTRAQRAAAQPQRRSCSRDHPTAQRGRRLHAGALRRGTPHMAGDRWQDSTRPGLRSPRHRRRARDLDRAWDAPRRPLGRRALQQLRWRGQRVCHAPQAGTRSQLSSLHGQLLWKRQTTAGHQLQPQRLPESPSASSGRPLEEATRAPRS